MKIKGLLVKVNEKPKIIEFDESLHALQNLVHGNIEFMNMIEEDVDLVVNEEGKINGMPINRFLLYDGKLIDVIMGDFVIVGVDNETGETISIPEDKILKYKDLFSYRYVVL